MIMLLDFLSGAGGNADWALAYLELLDAAAK